jgi:gamma-glutamyltranspeptidase/glutathione hydrolase
MAQSTAASTHPAAVEAALEALRTEPGEVAGTAIDGMLAGVLAIAARHPGVLLGAGTILLGGTGEGALAIDARARQPGISAPRPRGFTEGQAVPDAARVAASVLPAALTLAHAGRGVRTRTALVRAALSAANAITKVDEARTESLRAFGREGGQILRGGRIQEATLAASARSLGGLLGREDLEAVAPAIVPAVRSEIEGKSWAIAPWSHTFEGEHAATTGELAVVAASDAFGAVAIAAVLVPTFATIVPEIGLALPHLAEPTRRGVERLAPGTVLPMQAPIAIGGMPVDLVLGVGGEGDAESTLAELVRRVGSFEDVIAPHQFGIATGIAIDRGRGRPLVDHKS